MKYLTYIYSATLLITLLSIIGCKSESDDPAPTETEIRLTELQNNGLSWVLSNEGVTKDGFDVTDQFAGFKLNIGNKTYSTENGLSPVWKPSGTWDFENNNPNQILRDGTTSINVSISSDNLVLTFTTDAVPTGGRIESVSGEYQFRLVSE